MTLLIIIGIIFIVYVSIKQIVNSLKKIKKDKKSIQDSFDNLSFEYSKIRTITFEQKEKADKLDYEKKCLYLLK